MKNKTLSFLTLATLMTISFTAHCEGFNLDDYSAENGGISDRNNWVHKEGLGPQDLITGGKTFGGSGGGFGPIGRVMNERPWQLDYFEKNGRWPSVIGSAPRPRGLPQRPNPGHSPRKSFGDAIDGAVVGCVGGAATGSLASGVGALPGCGVGAFGGGAAGYVRGCIKCHGVSAD